MLTFFSSKPKASKPDTDVTYFLLLRSIRLMVTTLLASLSACFCSAASALAAFFLASFAARSLASTLSEAVAASNASVWCDMVCQSSAREPNMCGCRWMNPYDEFGRKGESGTVPVKPQSSHTAPWLPLGPCLRQCPSFVGALRRYLSGVLWIGGKRNTMR